MSPHRLLYTDLQQQDPARTGPDLGRVIFRLVLVVFTVLAALHGLAQLLRTDRQVAPLRAAAVDTSPLPPVDVADARVEGFRAGFEAALQHGCRQPMALAMPILPR